ncbi:MAG: 3'(2'),5'-bisphosphate nucleotidase CysQ [Bacteroidetes bacterium]|nr:3'(2'),5'-bisphosphate nucleotidase CysQ [Bacteroidota bacterium]
MVDPLDGTKEFIKRNGEFTVNIALIHQGEVVLGVVYLPVSQTAYFAVKNCGAFKQVEQETSLLNGGVPLAQDLDELLHADWHGKSLKIVASRSHLNTETQEFIDQLINNHAEVEIVSKGSSLKFCMIAEHEADIYPRYAPTMEWDTAAAHIIATESGKKVIDTTTNQAPRYNKESLRNNEFVVF